MGHTLELVITDFAFPHFPSLHGGFIYLHPHQARTPNLFQKSQNIDPDTLTVDLQHLLCTHTSAVSKSVDCYNNTLGSILDVHALVKVRTV